MFPYRESTSCGTTVECSGELVGVRIGTNRYITILDGELREVIAMLIHLAAALAKAKGSDHAAAPTD